MERLNESRRSFGQVWRNPGIRRLAVVCLVSALLLMLFAWAFSRYQGERLKREWLARDEQLIGTIAAGHPEIASELPRLFADNSSGDSAIRERGRELAARYGLTRSVDPAVLPIVESYRTNLWATLSIALGLFVLLSAALLLRVYDRPYRHIRRLAISLENSVKQNAPMDKPLYEDGELGLLSHAVQELSLRLQETIAQLHKEKSLLKDTVADISHQLKTPLASLTIYVELLQDPRTSQKDAREFLDTCRRELDRMEWLILTLLKIARLEAEALELAPVKASLSHTIETALDPLRSMAEQRMVELVVNAQEELTLLHDPRWLSEAFTNLVKNAIEHSPEGGQVSIRIERTPLFAHISVKDQGEGIDERHLPHIFKKFYQSSPAGSGVGLGLPLAKSIIEKHEGLISASSRPKEGTSFTVTLPLHRSGSAGPSLTNL
ncbi:sensor histidine kinase KdpD [Cohnella sp. AR92]|uniref:sensor histidine kinase n=1 Tax=Cohnella sp. AR92 TaxID=648716 RepID=UPI000F8E08B1|nr:HAMP domain-containing sensor histidine kinase [Cohnella sp. AR92]RUS47468.1 HAMP domain-containing histidine kinase [Cohnella sp. AR92]